MRLSDAEFTLGLTAPYTDLDVRDAFRRLARRIHPDTGQDRMDLYPAALEARKKCLEWARHLQDPRCEVCDGTGVLGAGPLTTKTCPVCKGSGQKGE